MTIKKQLEKIRDENSESLRAYVASEMIESLDNYNGSEKEQVQSWYDDLMRGGCQSGFISGLIYYADTHKFFDKYYDDIEELRQNFEENTGEDILCRVNGDLKNWLAWFGFEETARNIAEELGLES